MEINMLVLHTIGRSTTSTTGRCGLSHLYDSGTTQGHQTHTCQQFRFQSETPNMEVSSLRMFIIGHNLNEFSKVCLHC